jgi:hypothetical protein
MFNKIQILPIHPPPSRQLSHSDITVGVSGTRTSSYEGRISRTGIFQIQTDPKTGDPD